MLQAINYGDRPLVLYQIQQTFNPDEKIFSIYDLSLIRDLAVCLFDDDEIANKISSMRGFNVAGLPKGRNELEENWAIVEEALLVLGVLAKYYLLNTFPNYQGEWPHSFMIHCLCQLVKDLRTAMMGTSDAWLLQYPSKQLENVWKKLSCYNIPRLAS